MIVKLLHPKSIHEFDLLSEVEKFLSEVAAKDQMTISHLEIDPDSESFLVYNNDFCVFAQIYI